MSFQIGIAPASAPITIAANASISAETGIEITVITNQMLNPARHALNPPRTHAPRNRNFSGS